MEAQLTQLKVTREDVMKPLQKVIGVVKEKQTMHMLSHVRVIVDGNEMSVTGTDSEVLLEGKTKLINAGAITNMAITLPGRKLAEICRALPDSAPIELYHESDRVILRSGKSRFTLTTLPAEDFPTIEQTEASKQFSIPQSHLRELLQQTAAFMAQQDVRYYLNGLLLTVQDNQLIAVATDGHRLAKSSIALNSGDLSDLFIIVPRKGVLELMRLLADEPDEVNICVGKNHISIQHPTFSFVSRLIEGKFPDFERVIPSSACLSTKIDRDTLKESLQRVMILCSEKYKAIRFQFRKGNLRILVNNPQQESAEDTLAIDYTEGEVDIGFNIKYLIDMLNTIPPGPVQISFSNADHSVLFESLVDAKQKQPNAKSLFVIMPMRL
jgi:DNA polymerase III subunit beta